MELIAVEMARILTVLPAGQEVAPTRVSWTDITKALVGRYGFEKYPTSRDDVAKSGAEFISGRWHSTPISKLTILARGLAVETQTDTDDSEEILKDALDYLSRECNLPLRRGKGERSIYFSMLTFTSDALLNWVHPILARIGDETSRLVGPYGEQKKYETTGITINLDDSNLKVQPGAFRIERRAGIPFSENSYFSVAPLRTSDHRRLLGEFEAALIASKP